MLVLNKSSGFKRLNQAAVLTVPSLSLQVYLINVTYSDNTSHIIYRRYSKFFDLQVIPRQPVWAMFGLKSPMLPPPPADVFFSRSSV